MALMYSDILTGRLSHNENVLCTVVRENFLTVDVVDEQKSVRHQKVFFVIGKFCSFFDEKYEI